METIKLRRKFCMKPNLFDTNLETHLFNKINNVLTGFCTKSYGYVISINPEFNIIDNEVSANGSILFDVEFTANTLKPKVGQVLEGKVCMIFNNGIFVEVEGKMKVLIPSNRIENMSFNQTSETFDNENTSIHLGDVIKLQIYQLRYHKRGFKIIGILID